MSALTRCLEEEASAIATAAERLSSDQVEAALALLERCADHKAKLVITGVGKSGIVARKIAATFSSIGLMDLLTLSLVYVQFCTFNDYRIYIYDNR